MIYLLVILVKLYKNISPMKKHYFIILKVTLVLIKCIVTTTETYNLRQSTVIFKANLE